MHVPFRCFRVVTIFILFLTGQVNAYTDFFAEILIALAPVKGQSIPGGPGPVSQAKRSCVENGGKNISNETF